MMMKGIFVAADGVKKRNQSVENVEEMSEKVRKMNSPRRKESDGSQARRKRRAADDGNDEGEGAEVEAKTSDEVRSSEGSQLNILPTEKSLVPLLVLYHLKHYTDI